MKENNIPKHWQIKKLGEVCNTTSGGTPSRQMTSYYNGNIPWVKSGELDKGLILDTEEKISEDAIKNSSAKIFPKGTLLIALYGATIGKLAFLGIEAATNQAVCGIYKNEIIDSNFLYHFLYYKKHNLVKQGIGGAQPNISQGILKNLELPIPPLPEQQAIVAKVEELFSELENGKQQLLTAQQQLKVYRQSLLKWAFEGKLTNKNVKEGELPKGWKIETLGNITHKIVDGTHHTPKYTASGVPFVSVKDIRDYKIDFSDTKFIDKLQHIDLIKRCNPEMGDILITKSGTIGRLAIVPNHEFSLFVSVALLKINKDIIQSKYALYAIQNHVNHLDVSSQIKGGVIKNYHLEDLRIAKIILAPFEKQNEIVSELESRLTVCDKIEETIAECLQQSETLKQSILKKVFEGKLIK